MADETKQLGSIAEVTDLLLTPKYSLAIWVTCLTLFACENYYEPIGVFLTEYGKFAVPAGILAAYTWIIQVAWYGFFAPVWSQHGRFRDAYKCLNGPLSDGERAFLSAAIAENEPVHELDADPDVLHLVNRNVLVPLAEGKYMIDRAVWGYMQKRHRELIVLWGAQESASRPSNSKKKHGLEQQKKGK